MLKTLRFYELGKYPIKVLRMGIDMQKGITVAKITFFSILVLVVFLFIFYSSSQIQQETVNAHQGYKDLSDFDFNKRLAYVNGGFLYYNEELYTPEDFRSEEVTTEYSTVNQNMGRFSCGNYGTYRIVLKLPKGKNYGISSYSAMYSQRIFINGREYQSIGKPGKTSVTTVSKTKHYTFYFTPNNTSTEIVIQFANHKHSDNGGIFALYLGSQENIQERDAITQQRISILAGCLITAFLFFAGMFVFFNKRFSFLWFSISCFSIALRILIVNEKAIMILVPHLSWELSLWLEYMSLIVLIFSFSLYINNIYQGALHKVSVRLLGTLCTFYAILVCLTPPIIYTKYILIFQIASAIFGLYAIAAIIYNFATKKNNRNTEHIMVFGGIFIFIILAVLDIRIHRSGGFRLPMGLTEIGMITLIFLNMIALSLQFSNTEGELNVARQNEKQMQETNQLLDRMSRLKSDFLANISHEMRTPLTVMSSYASLTSMQIKRDLTNQKTIDNLNAIVKEAARLANLVEQIKKVSLQKQRQLVVADIDAIALLKRACDFCRPICRKNKNQIQVDNDAKKIILKINEESIFQTLINLIINANRHTRDGIIKLTVEAYNTETNIDFAKIVVSDNGDGIDAELIPTLFDRGVSSDGGSGLGLTISKEIIEEHSGTIWVKSKKGQGTYVFFTLPCFKTEKEDKIYDNYSHC